MYVLVHEREKRDIHYQKTVDVAIGYIASFIKDVKDVNPPHTIKTPSKLQKILDDESKSCFCIKFM